MRGTLLSVIAGIGLFVALGSWAYSSPVGSAPDDTYHLPTIWCSWGEHESCARDEQGSLRAPQTVSDVCTYQRPLVSASCVYLRSDRLVTVGHLTYVGSNQELQGNAVFHRVLRVFVGPDAERSALYMRLFNVGLAVVMFVWALLVSRGGPRRALALSWLVASVPVGMFMVSSTNPSGWVVTGVSTYWAFLLAVIRPSKSGSTRRTFAFVGLIVSAFIAVGARADALVFIGGSTVAVLVISWPQIRSKRATEWGLLVLGLAFVVPVAVTSVRDRLLMVIGGIGSDEGADPRLTKGGLDPTLNHLLELPSFVWALIGGQSPAFAFPTAYLRGLGWLDTGIPSISGLLSLGALVAVAVWGMSVYDSRKASALGVTILTLCLAIILPLEGANFVSTYGMQPRYVLPMLLVVVAVSVLRPLAGGRPRLALIVVVVGSMIVADAAAQLTSLHRYTNGESLPWMRLDMEPNWWWPGAPVGPTGVWLIGVVGFTVFATTVGLIARTRTRLGRKSSVDHDPMGLDTHHIR
jgi:hypothetical protein